MQNKKNSKIISKLVLSTTAAFMATIAVKATEEPNDVQSQVENFQQEDQLQVAYAEVTTSITNETNKEITADNIVYKIKTIDETPGGTGSGEANGDIILTGVYSKSSVPENLEIEESITGKTSDSKEVGYDVVRIGKNAFDSCVNLRSVSIPDSVESVDNYAFYNCDNLNFVKFEDASEINFGTNPLNSGKVKFVYVDDEAGKNNVIQKLRLKEDQVRLTEIIDSPSASVDKVDSATSYVTSGTDGVKVSWEHSENNQTEMYVVLRQGERDLNPTAIGIKYGSDATNNKLEFIDNINSFGEKYTYTIRPYNLHSAYGKSLTVDDFEKLYQYDVFGLKTDNTKWVTEEFTRKLLTNNNITSYYTTVNDTDYKGNTVTRVGSFAYLGEGNSHSVYSLDGNRYKIEVNPSNIDWENPSAVNINSSNSALYVREWDMESSSEKDEFVNGWGADSSNPTRVFSLQVVNDVDGDQAMIESTDICANGASNNEGDIQIPLYIEIDKNWDTSKLSIMSIQNGQDDIPLSYSITSDGKYIKVMLDKFYRGPYAIYADKLENAGTNNSELCETCGKSKDECTCKKDECSCDDDCACKKEDGTCECGKNDCKCTGTSSSTSHGYKTGDVASAGLLQSAFGMLAAAGSTLMGLFRKKKDRE